MASTRSSLGRLASIGELYDVRDESLKSRCLFKRSMPKEFVQTVSIANTDFNFEFIENFSDKFNFFQVETELQLGVLFKVIKVQGSGEFLTQDKKSGQAISCSLMCQIRTEQDKFFASFDEIRTHIDLTALRNTEYTHYVSQTIWGANCLLNLEFAFKDEDQKRKIKGTLKSGLSNFKKLADLEVGGELVKNNSEFWSSRDLKIKVHADVVPENKLPTTVEGFFEFLPTLPKLLKNVNGGKGKPLSFVLTPLEELRQLALVENSVDVMVGKINLGFVASTVFLFDQIGAMKQRLHDLHSQFSEEQHYVKSEDINKATNMMQMLSVKESNLKQLILDSWAQVRSGVKELKDLIREVEESKSFDLKLFEYEQYLHDCSLILKKLSTIKMYTSRKVVYLGKDDTFTNLQLHHPRSEFIVLVICSEFEKMNSDLYRNTMLYFTRLIEEQRQNTIYVVVDLDLTCENLFLQVSEAKCFHICGNGRVKKDMYAYYLEEMCSNFARLRNSVSFQLCKHKPGNRVPLEIPCPGFEVGTCPSKLCTWICFTCRDNIEYGFDGNLYCICGVCPQDSFEYRCKEDTHGNLFLTPTEGFLNKTLSSLRPLKEMNIAIFGQTGVGKSTWINSIVNYLTYDTMLLAKEQGVICTIPVRYSFHDPLNYEQHEIRLGEKPPDEEMEIGMSDTQSARTYSFLWEGRCVRIIDTPGIGDTRGIKKDEENMKSIIEHLSYLKELHGLCILVKASDSKMTALFSYCMKELLVYLPKSIVKNIVFCFTNSRGALYTAGPGSAILSKLITNMGLEKELSLGKQNMFILDNEAFVFLCSLGCSDFTYSSKVINSFEDSWKMAAEETQRLFNTVKTFEPHILEETISLVNVRERILTLTKPLAEVAKTIEMNLTRLERKEEELQMSSLTIQELQEELFIDEIFLEMIHLPYPQTVCTAKSCITVVEFNKEKQIEYKTICHHKCYLTQVEPRTVNNYALRKCDIMFADFCTNCGCGWEEHMHLTYTQKRVTKKVKNTTVQEKIEKKEMELKTKEELIQNLREKTDKYREEQDKIIKAAVKFGLFLKNNAIKLYNDSIKEYLEHLIREQEKIKDDNEEGVKLLEALKNTLEQYNTQVSVLQSVLDQAEGTETLTAEEIYELEKSLYKLQLTGEQIQQCVEVSRSATSGLKAYRETPIQISVQHRKKPGFMGTVKNVLHKLF